MKSIASCVALAMAAATLGLAPAASAQSARPDPLNPQAQVPAQVYRSEFQGYRPNVEAGVGSWTDANKAVHQAGGWRAYAREARQSDPAAAPAPAASAPRPKGHEHH
ncbi:hypothetical protein [Roseateles sp.]|uniref:hypothetical protein n=1 Tax=Roseateles sp. TaxID=1971397 RepID=UPI0025CCFC10|nr:hypothetical protein [Roseateles sp.]MBV8037131.1 hypothetical protein [Roseateles sp.]